MIVDINYLFSKKIGIGEFFGTESDDVTIELKEMGQAQATKFQKLIGSAGDAAQYFVDQLPSIIVDHDLYADEVHKFTADEVAKMISNRAELCLTLLNKYATDVLFTRGKKSE